MHLVDIERKEVQRREEELRARKELLAEKQRIHAKIENDIIEQVNHIISSFSCTYILYKSKAPMSNRIKLMIFCFTETDINREA